MVDLRWGTGVCCGMLSSTLWVLFYLHRYTVLRRHQRGRVYFVGCGFQRDALVGFLSGCQISSARCSETFTPSETMIDTCQAGAINVGGAMFCLSGRVSLNFISGCMNSSSCCLNIEQYGTGMQMLSDP